jgi:hypothetical protein
VGRAPLGANAACVCWVAATENAVVPQSRSYATLCTPDSCLGPGVDCVALVKPARLKTAGGFALVLAGMDLHRLLCNS